MNNFILIFFFITSNAFAYDATIFDQSGSVTGYIEKVNNKVCMIDKYGRKGNCIDSKGYIKDNHGKRIGRIKTK